MYETLHVLVIGYTCVANRGPQRRDYEGVNDGVCARLFWFGREGAGMY